MFLKICEQWKKLETEAATVIRELTNTEIEIKEEQEEQNMCKAIEQMKEKERKIGLEDGKRIGLEDGDNFKNVSKGIWFGTDRRNDGYGRRKGESDYLHETGDKINVRSNLTLH